MRDAAVKQPLRKTENESENTFHSLRGTGTSHYAIPNGIIVMVELHAFCNFEEPRDPHPGTERVAEGVENVQQKFVFERQAQTFHAENVLRLKMIQAVLGNLQGQPGAWFPDGNVQVDLALRLQGV